MGRVIQPLRRLGARLAARDGDRLLPLAAMPAELRGAPIEMGVASAQLKSCLLLAGLYASGVTEIAQPEESRDHTERMLGARVTELDEGLVIEGGTLRGGEVESHDDHRMAMSLAVAALAAGAPALIAGGECVDISYPTFWPDLERLAPGSTREA
jgi:3-phosphoshikimate 1-carboxyvinyltransferase